MEKCAPQMFFQQKAFFALFNQFLLQRRSRSNCACSKSKEPETFDQSLSIAKEGGNVAKDARSALESRIGKSVISPLNASDKPALEVKNDEEKAK